MKHLTPSPSAATRWPTTRRWREILVAGLLVIGSAATAAAQTLSVTTFAGQAGSRGSADGTGGAARFFGPSGIVADGAGGFYVADALNNTIRRVSSTAVVTTVAGGNINEITNLPDRGYADGSGRSALFSFGIAETSGFGARTMGVDSKGSLYLADTLNYVIRKITADGVVTTLAGSPGNSGSLDGTGAAAQFSVPYGVAVDGSGSVYVADSGNNTIRKITSAGVVTTFAGHDGPNAGSLDGAGTNARFNNPSGVAADSAGNIYVSDTNNHTIRKITSAGVVSTLVGLAGTKGSSDGIGKSARFSNPTGLSVDSAGNVYVADTGNGTIRKVTPGGVVSTLAGFAGLSGIAEGTGNAVRFTTPYGVAVDGSGNVFVADTGNHTIRKGVAASAPAVTIQTQPKSQFVNVGAKVLLAVEATATPAPTFQWRKNNVNIAGATGATLTIASAQFSDEASYTVVVTSNAASVTSTAGVLQVYPATVVIPPIIFITQPSDLSLLAGQSATFFVEVAGSATPAFQWQKNEVNISGATGSSFTIGSLQASDAGSYRVVVTAGGDTQNSISVGLAVSGAVTPPPPPPPPPAAFGRIINLSILTSIAAGGDNFTMGYVVGGNATSGAKSLVIRAAGPSLGALGVPGTLDDPKLELFAGSSKTGENDNWGGSTQLTAALAAVGAFAYVSPTSKDAATTASITSRDNSVVVSAANNGAGAVIAEIYDATPSDSFVAATPRLINVSVRKNLGTGLTAGFVLGGSAPTKVLIRAVGPTLGVFGVPGVVADPQLTLFNDKSVKIGENNDWGGTAELTAAFTAVGAFALPAASKDAAVLVTLPPGLYSVQVAGVANTTGVALVEVYEVP
jgi:hypothetical protein